YQKPPEPPKASFYQKNSDIYPTTQEDTIVSAPREAFFSNNDVVRKPEYVQQYMRPEDSNTYVNHVPQEDTFEENMLFRQEETSFPTPQEKTEVFQEESIYSSDLEEKPFPTEPFPNNPDFQEEEPFENNYPSFDMEKHNPPSAPRVTSADTKPLVIGRRRRKEHSTPFAQLAKGLSSLAEKASQALNAEENDGLIDGLPPPGDKNQSFHTPVYPTDWKENESKNTENL
ncbi:MAG: hypothetical protein GX786_07590, partial [Clostridiales bacterium]|nr:hypothetical protein [Clostridiales bacterium]